MSEEKEQIVEDEQLDEFKATGEPSEVPEPTATKTIQEKLISLLVINLRLKSMIRHLDKQNHKC